DDRQQGLGLDLADALKAILQPALLRRHLRALVGVLRGAAAADAEMRAARLAPARAVMRDRGGRADIELAALFEDPHLRVLARQRALDEDHLALGAARDAAALVVEGVDVELQAFQSERNFCQCGSGRFSSCVRSS